jgi:hypothetical protein
MAIADSGWRKIKAMFDLVLRIATAIDCFMSSNNGQLRYWLLAGSSPALCC